MSTREEAVLRKCAYFAAIGAWPTDDWIRPKLWLQNFDADERHLAVELLDAFVYYNGMHMRSTFRCALHQLHNRLRRLGHDWTEFVSKLFITYPTGEAPSPTDSGHTFAMMARNFGFPEERIVEPSQALAMLINRESPIVFVDDFLGSGSQMFRTWTRPYPVGATYATFASAWTMNSPPIFYCCAFAASLGIENLRQRMVQVTVEAPYVLEPKDGVLSPETRLLHPTVRDEVQEMVRRRSLAIGFRDTNGQCADDWRGFAKLGLALSHEGGTPDATLPLFYMERNGWRPLVRHA